MSANIGRVRRPAQEETPEASKRSPLKAGRSKRSFPSAAAGRSESAALATAQAEKPIARAASLRPRPAPRRRSGSSTRR